MFAGAAVGLEASNRHKSFQKDKEAASSRVRRARDENKDSKKEKKRTNPIFIFLYERPVVRRRPARGGRRRLVVSLILCTLLLLVAFFSFISYRINTSCEVKNSKSCEYLSYFDRFSGENRTHKNFYHLKTLDRLNQQDGTQTLRRSIFCET